MQSGITPMMTRPRVPVWLMAALLVLGTTALYWPATHFGFVNFDDTFNVTDNVHIQKGLTWENIKWAFLNPMATLWQPLTMLSHMAICQVCGLNPWGHHLANVLLHALNAGLVFAWLQLMTGATWRSLLVAALFAVHPLRVEAVAWVTERRDVLSAFFGLLALIAYARYAQARMQNAECRMQNPATRNTQHVLRFTFHACSCYLLSLFFLALGLMSKPMLVTWPLVMLLLDYWPLGRMQKRMQKAEGRRQNSEASDTSTLRSAAEDGHHAPRNTPHVSRFTFHASLLLEKVPFFFLAALASVVTFLVQKQAGAVMGAERLSVGARIANALISYGRYLGKLFWPVNLAVYYPHPGHWPLGKVLLAGGLILGISVLVWVPRRRYPYLLMGWLWYCGTLVPVSQVIQTGAHAMADRWTYLPCLGVLTLVVWGAYELTRRLRYQVPAWSVAGGAAIVLCLALTRQQIGYWRDSEALFRHALAVTENNAFAHNGLGVALDKRGQIDEAIRQLQEALRLNPDSAGVHYNLGVAFFQRGRTAEAIRQFQETLRLNPDCAEAHNNLGTALGLQGQTADAIRHFQEALRLKPDYADARKNLDILLATKPPVSPPPGTPTQP
jgi:tetratricopeptide (TPR) repeat protein